MSLRRFIFHNFWLKLFSLMLAGMIWYAVFSIQGKSHSLPGFTVGDVKKTFDQVPVVILTSPSDTAVYTISPSAVNVTLTGSRKTLESLTAADVQVFINLSNTRVGSRKLERKQDVNVYLPEPVDGKKISPSYVFVDRITP